MIDRSLKLSLIVFFLITVITCGYSQELLRTNNAFIRFVSEAPLELIKAESEKCQGILNTKTGEFAFRIFIKSFEGFNNPLQKEHFYENYMEVSEYPEAVFRGNLIEDFETISSDDSIYRAKGNLLIHGVLNERIIEISLKKNGSEIQFNASFKVALEDHNIEIPNIVRQKIAENINVSVSGILQ